MKIPDLTPREVARFYSKISIDGCGMLWDGPANSHGYGRFEIYRNGRRVRILAHRLAYALATGEDPGEAHIRHACDNPPCVTPDCLDPGTRFDNMQDAIRRGRMNMAGLEAFREARIAEATARIDADEKPCSRCAQTKPMGEFALNRHNVDGHAYWCKTCTKGGMSERERRRLKRQQRRERAA
jgi:hypothetical protein